jgi:hypothetical protein
LLLRVRILFVLVALVAQRLDLVARSPPDRPLHVVLSARDDGVEDHVWHAVIGADAAPLAGDEAAFVVEGQEVPVAAELCVPEILDLYGSGDTEVSRSSIQ